MIDQVSSLVKQAITRLAFVVTTVAGLFGSYWTVFQTHLAAGVKGPIGSAALALIAVWVHEHHATARNTDQVAAMIGKAGGAVEHDAQALLNDLMGSVGMTAPTLPTSGVTMPSVPVHQPPGS